MSLLVRTSTDAGALLVQDTDDPLALAVTESTSALALRVRESTSPLAMRVRGLFSPASLPGLAAWYDASDSSTVLTTVSPDVPASNGQTVRRWVSRHNPAVFWDQDNLVIQPKLNDPNPGINFNGTSQFMAGTGTMAGVFQNRGYGYIFAVAQDTNPAAGQATHAPMFFSTGGTGPARSALYTRLISNALYAAGGRRLDADTFANSQAASSSNLALLDAHFLWTENVLRLGVNGVNATAATFSSGAGNTSNTASTQVNLGQSYITDNQWFPGNIRELVIVNQELTAAQILATRRYLQRKWSTPALP
jgi:hypothetical protein